MKSKIEYLVLFAVIAGLCALIYARDRNRVNYTLPDTGGVAAGDIAKIEIKRPGEKDTVLLKRNGKWLIMPAEAPARATDVDKMCESLASLTLTSLVAEDKNDPRYGLSEKDAVSVTAFSADGKVVRKVFIGKGASSYNHTFVSLEGDPAVYHARGRLGDVFDKSAEALRDKTVLAFEKDLVTGIKISKGKKEISLEKGGAKQAEAGSKPKDVLAEAWVVAGSGEKADGKSVEHLVSELYKLQCKKFIEDKDAKDLGDPACRIVLSAGGEHTLSIFPSGENEDDDRPALSSDSKEPFLLPGYKAKRIVEEVSQLLGN